MIFSVMLKLASGHVIRLKYYILHIYSALPHLLLLILPKQNFACIWPPALCVSATAGVRTVSLLPLLEKTQFLHTGTMDLSACIHKMNPFK